MPPYMPFDRTDRPSALTTQAFRRFGPMSAAVRKSTAPPDAAADATPKRIPHKILIFLPHTSGS